MNTQIIKTEIEKTLMLEDCKIMCNMINQKYGPVAQPSESNDKTKIEIERNKNFNLLLGYMKKSTKIITSLTDEIRILQGRMQEIKSNQ